MTIFILLFLFTISLSLSAKTYSEEALYKCFLDDNKDLWKEYITSANWQQCSNKERQRLLNYEYGYIAYAISVKDADSKKLLNNFNLHLEEMAGKMAESTRLTYLSAASSYALSLNKWTAARNAPRTFSYADQALEADPHNPIALTLRGSIYFYCPKTFGGNKQLALDYMQQAEERFRQRGDTVNNWNYRSAQMIVAQCLEKTGRKDAAIAKCRSILREEPNFTFIRDCYLPELLGQKPRNGQSATNVGASYVGNFTE